MLYQIYRFKYLASSCFSHGGEAKNTCIQYFVQAGLEADANDTRSSLDSSASNFNLSLFSKDMKHYRNAGNCAP